jgi:hypothetical protein
VYAQGSEADHQQVCSHESHFSTENACEGLSSVESSLYLTKLSPCLGKDFCVISDVEQSIPIGSSGMGGTSCIVQSSDFLFIQYSCLVPQKQLEEKRFICLKASCIAMFSTLLLFAGLSYLHRHIAIEKSAWDLTTVNASDYTVELSLNDAQIDRIQRELKERNFRPDLPPGLRMKMIVVQELEQILREQSG